METNKSKALELVRAACPELMELSFGCQVKIKTADWYGMAVTHENERGNVWFLQDGRRTATSVPSYNLEIIGHKPQLQHWLRLLGKINTAYEHNGHWHTYALTVYPETTKSIRFNLNTGQPATEEDYKAIVDICV